MWDAAAWVWLVGSADLECHSSCGKEYLCDSLIRKYILYPEVLPNCLQYRLYLELNVGVAFIFLVC